MSKLIRWVHWQQFFSSVTRRWLYTDHKGFEQDGFEAAEDLALRSMPRNFRTEKKLGNVCSLGVFASCNRTHYCFILHWGTADQNENFPCGWLHAIHKSVWQAVSRIISLFTICLPLFIICLPLFTICLPLFTSVYHLFIICLPSVYLCLSTSLHFSPFPFQYHDQTN